MSAIFGILRFDGGEVSRLDLERMGAAMRHRGPDGARSEAMGPIGLGQCLMRVNREDLHEVQPLFDDAADLALVADCRIDNREALAETFGWPPATLHQRPDSAFVLEAYKRWDERCAEHLLGDFAFAIWDGRSRRLFLARDHMGQRYVNYHRGDGFFAFATEWNGLFALPQVPRVLRENAIACALFGDRESGRGKTYYEQLSGLEGGASLTVERSGELRLRSYWRPRADPVHLERDEHYYVDSYRAVLREAVACRTRRLLRQPALFLSGGIDSSAIAAMAGPPLASAGLRMIALSSVASDPDNPKDSRRGVEACAAAMPHLDVRYFTRGSETMFDQLERNFVELGVPVATDYVFRAMALMAREGGARLLMDGNGGDYTINYRGSVDWGRWLWGGDFRKFWSELRATATENGRWRWRPLRAHVIPGLVPARIVDWWRAARRGFRPAWRQRFIAAELGRELIRRGDADPRNVHGGARRRYRHTDFICRVLEMHRRSSRPVEAALSASMGLDFTRPFHDPRIVELALAIPDTYHFAHGRFRALARSALSGLVPPAILDYRGPNTAVEPDFASMRQAITEAALEDSRRLERDGRLSKMIDFARLRRRLIATAADESAEGSLQALHAIVLARFAEWAMRDNASDHEA